MTEVSSQVKVGEFDCFTPPPSFECDGTGDGETDHSYNDPADGVCAKEREESPPAPVEPIAAPSADTPPAETLPETGVETWHLVLAGVALISSGGLLIKKAA